MSVMKGLAVLVFSMGTLSAFGQATAPADASGDRPITDDDIAVLRQDVQAGKTDIITRSMNFSADQASAFWPVYKNYAQEQKAIGDERVALIKDYAANYDSLTDAQADSYIARALKFDHDTLALRQKCVPLFEKAIGAKQTAKFYQVDNRLSLLVNVQLASLLPIIK